MTDKNKSALVKLLRSLKAEFEKKDGHRSTVHDSADFLLAVLGVKI